MESFHLPPISLSNCILMPTLVPFGSCFFFFNTSKSQYASTYSDEMFALGCPVCPLMFHERHFRFPASSSPRRHPCNWSTSRLWNWPKMSLTYPGHITKQRDPITKFMHTQSTIKSILGRNNNKKPTSTKDAPTEDGELAAKATTEQPFSIKILPWKTNENCYVERHRHVLSSGQFFVFKRCHDAPVMVLNHEAPQYKYKSFNTFTWYVTGRPITHV